MRLMRILMAGALASSLLVASTAFAEPGRGWLESPGAARRAAEASGSEVAVSLPVGSGSGEIGIESGEEQPTWGPASFDVDEEGRFWIVDGVNSRLVVADADGSYMKEVPFREPAAGALDVDVVGERVFLLDLVSQPSAVREIDQLGNVAASWEIPDEYVTLGVSGVRVENGGSGVDIALEVAGSWEVPLVRGGKPAMPKRIPVRLRGNHAELPVQTRGEYALGYADTGMRFGVEKDWTDWKHASLTTYDRGFEIGKVTLESDAELGAVRFLGCDSTDSTYLFVEQMLDGGSRTNAYVKVFDRSGKPDRQARIPVEDIDAFPERLIRVTDAGDVFALVPRKNRVEIRRLALAQDLSATLPPSGEGSTLNSTPAPGEERGDEGLVARAISFASGLLAPEQAYAIWTRLDANDRAWDYVGNSWYCSSANYSRSCGDARPRYITASGKTYGSVPYCWGGWDTVGGFNQDMKDGLDAGDINCTGSKRSCTSGVDCSGFVSRIWGLGSKKSTYTLRDVSYAVSKSSMQVADAYIKPGSHAMMFRYYNSGGAQVFESTTSHQYDRVVTHARTTSELSTYGAYRYQNW